MFHVDNIHELDYDKPHDARILSSIGFMTRLKQLNCVKTIYLGDDHLYRPFGNSSYVDSNEDEPVCQHVFNILNKFLSNSSSVETIDFSPKYSSRYVVGHEHLMCISPGLTSSKSIKQINMRYTLITQDDIETLLTQLTPQTLNTNTK